MGEYETQNKKISLLDIPISFWFILSSFPVMIISAIGVIQTKNFDYIYLSIVAVVLMMIGMVIHSWEPM